MLPIRGQQALLFRLIAIPIAATLAAHFVIYRRFPGEPGYEFPWSFFLTIAGIMLACWEVNLSVFRRLDRTLPFHQNPARRIGRQVLEGGLLTTLTYAVIFNGIALVRFGVWPSLTGFVTGLFICFTIATLINGIYVGFYLLNVIYGQQPATTEQLNTRLTEHPQLVPVLLPATPPDPKLTRARSGILIETGTQLLQLQPDEIAYFHSAGGMVQLVQTDGRRLTTNYDALTTLTDKLPPRWFFSDQSAVFGSPERGTDRP